MAKHSHQNFPEHLMCLVFYKTEKSSFSSLELVEDPLQIKSVTCIAVILTNQYNFNLVYQACISVSGGGGRGTTPYMKKAI